MDKLKNSEIKKSNINPTYSFADESGKLWAAFWFLTLGLSLILWISISIFLATKGLNPFDPGQEVLLRLQSEWSFLIKLQTICMYLVLIGGFTYYLKDGLLLIKKRKEKNK